MDDYLQWLTSGLIFLWTLGAYDATPTPSRWTLAASDANWPRRASLPAGQAYSSKGEIKPQMVSHIGDTITQSCHMPATGPGTETGAR